MEIEGAWIELSPSGLDCDDPEVEARWLDPAMEELELCPEACALYMDAGALVFDYGLPAP